MMYSPKEIAGQTVNIGKGKASNTPFNLLLLGFMAGMFIAFGAVAANTISATIPIASVAKAAGAAVFPVGLAMVLIAGSELFTGNCLIMLGVFSGEIKPTDMIKNWVCVYIGNFIGGMFVCAITFMSGNFALFNNAVAVNTIGAAASKCSMDFGAALCSGIMCNVLVCIAVWMSFGAKSVGGKIAAMYLPVMTFVLAGFEHSVANMYFIPAGIIAKTNPAFLTAALEAGKNADIVTWGNFFGANLLPVTIGNIIGGGIVALVYRLVFVKKDKTT